MPCVACGGDYVSSMYVRCEACHRIVGRRSNGNAVDGAGAGAERQAPGVYVYFHW